jgi:hypothetical protein
VLDCANGYQKEKQKEVDTTEGNCPWQGQGHEEANAEGEDSQEVLEKDLCSEQSYGEREDVE